MEAKGKALDARRSSSSAARRRLAAAAGAALVALCAAAPAGATPNNTSPPTISGSEPRQDGHVLTANPGAWSSYPQTTVSYRYEWQRCAPGCTAIPGATGQSYTLGPADVGHRVRVRVYGNCNPNVHAACSETAANSAPTGTVLPDPLNEGRPRITGLAREGDVLAASSGFWRSVAPLAFAYQWARCDRAGQNCADVAGANRAEHRLGTGDVGATMRVAVTAANGRPRQATALSDASGVVARLNRRRARGPRLLRPFPTVVVAGLVSGMGRVRLTEFTIRGPRGVLARIRCRGRGCPFRTTRIRLRGRRARVRRLERVLRAGVVIEVVITRRGFIGKYSRFRIRRGRAPARIDRCLPPGARRPTRCPRRT